LRQKDVGEQLHGLFANRTKAGRSFLGNSPALDLVPYQEV